METSHETTDEDELQPCDLVFDKAAIGGDDTPSLGYVIGRQPDRCGEYEIENEEGEVVELHEFGVNPDYAGPDTPVVTIIFVSWLDGNAPGWEDHLTDIDGMLELLNTMQDEWRVPVDPHLYDYPQSRLSLRRRPE